MEAAIPLQLHQARRCRSLCATSFSTPLAANVRHLLPPENVRQLPMRYLIRNRITTSTTYPLKFNQTKIFSAVNSLKDSMADEANKKNSSSVESTISEEIKKKESVENLTPRNIPPPEKPLPGDCCGSGCVRCVWDVYYEELEEYNQLYKSGPDSNRPS